VAAALGETPAAGKPSRVFDTPECEGDPASGHNRGVTLDVGPWHGDPGIEPMNTKPAVSGIGDQAEAPGNQLYVRKGSQGFRIWVFNVKSQSTRPDIEKQLASTLLGEL
jgi:hypothetical protein